MIFSGTHDLPLRDNHHDEGVEENFFYFCSTVFGKEGGIQAILLNFGTNYIRIRNLEAKN